MIRAPADNEALRALPALDPPTPDQNADQIDRIAIKPDQRPGQGPINLTYI